MLPAASCPGLLYGAVMGFGSEYGARIVERGSVFSKPSPLDQFQDWACHEGSMSRRRREEYLKGG